MWLTVIIPVYNVEKYIRKCLDSIVIDNAVISGELEVIVVDDGTPDASGKIADEYAERFPYIRVLHKPNGGVAAARNTALREAQGEWVYFMDSDDWLVEGALEKIYKRMKAEKSADIFLLDAYQNKDEGETPWEHFNEEMIIFRLAGLQRGALYFPMCSLKTDIPLAAPWDKIYRRSFLVECDLHFQEQLKVLDDMIFNMDCFGRAKKVVYLKEKIYHYRFVPNSITNSYKKNRIEQDSMVWDYIASVYDRMQAEQQSMDSDYGYETELFLQSFYLRIVKSFSICCRLCFFHKDNQSPLKDKLQYVKEVASSGWYQQAFQNVKWKHAEWKLKVMIIIVRLHWWRGVYLLHKLANG